jgi:hypothetical protein
MKAKARVKIVFALVLLTVRSSPTKTMPFPEMLKVSQLTEAQE